jgi:pyruvate/2-oxoglutarate dehydrogenase complex dihydrolipoamide dehydrogenase (E3) component
VKPSCAETTAPNVWAIGECAGRPYFTHVSEDDFNIIHANLNGGLRTTRDRLVPYCIFLDPPLAHVGLNESQARVTETAYRVATLPMDAIWRPWTLSERRGFMKVLVEAPSLLGTVRRTNLITLPHLRQLGFRTGS